MPDSEGLNSATGSVKEYWNLWILHGSGTSRHQIRIQSELSLNKIVAHHISRNPASGRVMIKSGMRKEGSFREHVFKAGKFEDLEGYGILQERLGSIGRTGLIGRIPASRRLETMQ